MPKEISFKDVLNKSVNVGDKVVILVKYYGYRRISSANLMKGVYKGKSRGGYEFAKTLKSKITFRIRNPECVKIG